MSIHISRDGIVTGEHGEDLGMVDKVEWPHSRNGRVWTETVWEARKPHEIGLDVEVGTWPCFGTRQEAADFLAGLPSKEDKMVWRLRALAMGTDGASAKAARARESRDKAIREALEMGMSAYAVADIVGMSQPAVAKIRDKKTD